MLDTMAGQPSAGGYPPYNIEKTADYAWRIVMAVAGFTEAELADGGSDRFIDAMVLWGDADTIRRGLRAHFTAGATHVCLQPVHAEGDFAARDRILAALADT